VESKAQHFVVCWFSTIFLLSYYFLEFDEFIFSFQDTYNSRLKERYEEDSLTHPDLDLDLWLEAESFSGLDRNRVYRLSNTMVEKLRMTRNVLTVGCLQLVLSTQTPEFAAMLDQRVQDQMTHLDEKYE
jgi:hypothetical protein